MILNDSLSILAQLKVGKVLNKVGDFLTIEADGTVNLRKVNEILDDLGIAHIADITQAQITSWDAAAALSHSHPNMANLNTINQNLGTANIPTFLGINVDSILFNAFTGSDKRLIQTSGNDLHIGNGTLDSVNFQISDVDKMLVNNTYKVWNSGNLTQQFLDNVATAVANSHTHNNLGLLQTYTQTEANLADAVGLRHGHTNKSLLDAITQQNINDWNNASSSLGNYVRKIGDTMTGALLLGSTVVGKSRVLHLGEPQFTDSYGFDFLTDSNSGKLTIHPMNAGVRSTLPALTINRTNNFVGINTENPTTTLEVGGNSTLRGRVYVGTGVEDPFYFIENNAGVFNYQAYGGHTFKTGSGATALVIPDSGGIDAYKNITAISTDIRTRKGNMQVGAVGIAGGWARSFEFTDTSFGTIYGGLSMYGSGANPELFTLGFEGWNDANRIYQFRSTGNWAIGGGGATLGGKLDVFGQINTNIHGNSAQWKEAYDKIADGFIYKGYVWDFSNDYNLITDEGRYAVTADATQQTMLNRPSNYSGVLEVTYNNAGSWCFQRFTEYAGNEATFTRRFYSGSWTAWVVQRNANHITDADLDSWKNKTLSLKGSFVSATNANNNARGTGLWELRLGDGSGNTNWPANNMYGNYQRISSDNFNTDIAFRMDGAMYHRSFWKSNSTGNIWRRVWDDTDLTEAEVNKLIAFNPGSYLLLDGSNATGNLANAISLRHNPVTLGTANGLSLNNQIISMALASATTTGALSAANFISFDNKISANDGSISYVGTGAIAGGGSSSANQAGSTNYSFDLTAATKADIGLGVTAYNSLGNYQTALSNGLSTVVNGNKIDVAFENNTWIKDKLGRDFFYLGSTGANQNDTSFKRGTLNGELKFLDADGSDLMKIGSGGVVRINQLAGTGSRLLLADLSGSIFATNLDANDIATMSWTDSLFARKTTVYTKAETNTLLDGKVNNLNTVQSLAFDSGLDTGNFYAIHTNGNYVPLARLDYVDSQISSIVGSLSNKANTDGSNVVANSSWNIIAEKVRNFGGDPLSDVNAMATLSSGLESLYGRHSNGYIYRFDATALNSFLGVNNNWNLQQVTNNGANTTIASTFNGLKIGVNNSLYNGIESSNNMVGFTDFGGSTASRVLTGGLLASDHYADVSLIPVNGIHSKGDIHTKGRVLADTIAGASGGNLKITTNTSGASSLIFETQLLERMRILSNGYVGINNNNPQYHLDVNGTIATASHGTSADWWSATQAVNNKEDAYVHSQRDFPNGTLIETDINYPAISGEEFELELKGNTYFDSMPLFARVQGYAYNNTIISQGGFTSYEGLASISVMGINGKLFFWFPRLNYWQGFSAKVNASSNKAKQRVISISDSPDPMGSQRVDIGLQIIAYRNWVDGYYTKQAGYYPSLEVGKADNATKWNNETYAGNNVTSPIYFMTTDSAGWGHTSIAQVQSILGINTAWNLQQVTNNGANSSLRITAGGFESYQANIRIIGNSVNTNQTKLILENQNSTELWALSHGVNNLWEENFSIGTLDNSNIFDWKLIINNVGLITSKTHGTSADWYQGYVNSQNALNLNLQQVTNKGATTPTPSTFNGVTIGHVTNGFKGFDSDTDYSFLNSGNAARVFSGGLLASNSYQRANLIPNEGIYSHGAIRQGDLAIGELPGILRMTRQSSDMVGFLSDSNGWADIQGKIIYSSNNGNSTDWNAKLGNRGAWQVADTAATYPLGVTYWATGAGGFIETYGTSLHLQSDQPWYVRLDIPTGGTGIELWQGINSTTMSNQGYLPLVQRGFTNWDSNNLPNPITLTQLNTALSNKVDNEQYATKIGFNVGVDDNFYGYNSNTGNNVTIATRNWVNNNFISNTALGNYVNKAGDTMSGNLGIGITPSAWAYRNVIQVGKGGSISASNDNNFPDNIDISANVYLNSAWDDIYIQSNYAQRYRQERGNHIFYSATSGTSGQIISWSELFRINSIGNATLLGNLSIPNAIASNHAVALNQVPTDNNQLANGANYTTLSLVQSWINSQGLANTSIGVNGGTATNGVFTFIQGTNMSITKSGNNITFNATGGGGGGITNIATDEPNMPGPTASNMPIVFNSHVAYGKPETAIDDQEVGNGQIQVESGDVVRFHHSFDNVGTLMESAGNKVDIDTWELRKHIINVVFVPSGGSGGTVFFTAGVYTGDQINITVPRGQGINLQPHGGVNLISSVGQEVYDHANLIWDPNRDAWIVVSYG